MIFLFSPLRIAVTDPETGEVIVILGLFLEKNRGDPFLTLAFSLTNILGITLKNESGEIP